MILGEKRYNAKLLLFGEYSVLQRSKAFSFPLSTYGANWAKKDQLDPALAGFVAHAKETLPKELDIERMEVEYQAGLYLESNIPFGYGLGSSGSLVAAYLDRYLLSKNDSLESLKVKTVTLESYFHGKSSGTDPLISYFNYPLVFHDADRIELVSRALSTDKLHFYLLDSGVGRETSVLVKRYLDRYNTESDFAKGMQDIAALNDEIITATLDASHPDLMLKIHRLSSLQYQHMHDLILEDIKPLWDASLEEESYAFKLCGAGGGGFYLVVSESALALDKFDGYGLIEIKL